MSAVQAQSSTHFFNPKYLWFFTLSYAMVFVFSNWFAPRLITIGPVFTGAGILIFPLTFLLSDIITEIYGYKHARRAIWCGLLFNIIFMVYGQVIIRMPAPEFATLNQNFDAVLNLNTRIIIASIVSYLACEPVNSFIMAKLKVKLKGAYMGIRFVASTVAAACLDCLIFLPIAFYGILENSVLLTFMLYLWFIKVLVEVVCLPLSIRLTKKIKRLERLDIYDDGTDFSLFSLDENYTLAQNKYEQI